MHLIITKKKIKKLQVHVLFDFITYPNNIRSYGFNYHSRKLVYITVCVFHFKFTQ